MDDFPKSGHNYSGPTVYATVSGIIMCCKLVVVTGVSFMQLNKRKRLIWSEE